RKIPFWLIGPFVDEHIVALRCADAVVKHLAVAVRLLELGAFFRLVVAAVEESLAVERPRSRAELDPFQFIAQVAPGADLANTPGVPVASRSGNTIGEVFAVVARRESGQRDRPVLGKPIWVQEHSRLAARLVDDVQNSLILKSVVL